MTTASTSTSLLQNKHAVIFGASGEVGTGVAKLFAAQGATVFLSGRRLSAVSQLAAEIQQAGGRAYAAEVDALDEQAVQTYLDGVAKEAGSIDILLNVTGPQPKDYGNGTSTLELPLEQFLLPLTTLVLLKTLNGDQQVSMVQFFSHNGLSATFIGDALQGSTGLVGADLQQIDLPLIQFAQANLSRVNFREANLSDATLYRADLSGANLSHARLTRTDLRGVNLRGANLSGADLSESRMVMEKAGRDASAVQVQVGAGRYRALRANLSHALLSGAKLREANLVGADLSGATLTWGILDEADVRAAKVTEEQLQTVVSEKNLKREP